MNSVHSTEESFSNPVELALLPAKGTLQDMNIPLEIALDSHLNHQSTLDFIGNHLDDLSIPAPIHSQDVRTQQAVCSSSSIVDVHKYLYMPHSIWIFL